MGSEAWTLRIISGPRSINKSVRDNAKGRPIICFDFIYMTKITSNMAKVINVSSGVKHAAVWNTWSFLSKVAHK